MVSRWLGPTGQTASKNVHISVDSSATGRDRPPCDVRPLHRAEATASSRRLFARAMAAWRWPAAVTRATSLQRLNFFQPSASDGDGVSHSDDAACVIRRSSNFVPFAVARSRPAVLTTAFRASMPDVAATDGTPSEIAVRAARRCVFFMTVSVEVEKPLANVRYLLRREGILR